MPLSHNSNSTGIPRNATTASLQDQQFEAIVKAIASKNDAALKGTISVIDAQDRSKILDRRDARGATLLHIAVEQQVPDKIMQILINRGVDVNAAFISENAKYAGCTPLMLAAELNYDLNNKNLRPLLLQADFEARDAKSRTIMHRLADMDFENPANGTHYQLGNLQLLKSLGADLNARDVRGRTVLHTILDNEHIQDNEHVYQMTKTVLEPFKNMPAANPNLVDGDGRPPLNLAVDHYDKNVVALLVEYGANVNAVDPDNTSALMVAVRRTDYIGPNNEAENAKSIQYLLEHGADPNLTDHKGRTALIDAIRYLRSPQTLNLLMDYGAGTEYADSNGKTALHYALRTRVPIITDMAQSLILHGADFRKKMSMIDYDAVDAQLKKEFPQGSGTYDERQDRRISLEENPKYQISSNVLDQIVEKRDMESLNWMLKNVGGLKLSDFPGMKGKEMKDLEREWGTQTSQAPTSLPGLKDDDTMRKIASSLGSLPRLPFRADISSVQSLIPNPQRISGPPSTEKKPISLV